MSPADTDQFLQKNDIMKNQLTTIFLFVLSCFSICGMSSKSSEKSYQAVKKQTLDSIIVNYHNIDYAKYEIKYDNNYNQISHTSFNWDFQQKKWLNKSKTEKLYNSLNQTTKETDSFWDENNWITSGITEYFYDEKGDTCQIIAFRNLQNDSIRFSYKNVILRNKMGAKTHYITYKGKGNEFFPKSKAEYIYNKNESLVKENNYEFTNNNWKLVSSIRHIYDTIGKTTIYENVSKSGIRPYRKYIFDIHGNETNCYIKENNNWNLISKNKFIYLNNGLVSVIIHYKNSKNQWVEDFKETYLYGERDNLVKQIDYTLNDDKWEKKREYLYDSNGNLVQSIVFDGEGFPTIGKTFKFDKTKNISDLISNFTNKEEEWFWSYEDMDGSYKVKFTNKPLEILFQSWDKKYEKWETTEEIKYYYSE